MAKVRQLPAHIANQSPLARSERPGSVVKELTENAIGRWGPKHYR